MALKVYKPVSGPPFKHAIAIAAGKGGVGKSSLTVNLALALKKLGFRVGILDADLYGPSMRKMLPEERMPEQQGDKIFPALCGGIEMISMAFFRQEGQAAVVRAPIANGLISQFVKQVVWSELDFLLIDYPPGTGDIQISLSQQIKLTGAIIITTPQEVALLDVRKSIHMFQQVRIPLLGIVENMSFFQETLASEKHYLFGKGGGQKLAEENNVPLLCQIPVEPLIGRCQDEGRSLFSVQDPKAKLLQSLFEQLAQNLVRRVEVNSNELTPEIRQLDKHTFAIHWGDGCTSSFRLSEIQGLCPCAGCVDEATGERKIDPKSIPADLVAKTVQSVGLYAIKFEFMSGCSNGIYSYDYLRQIAR